LASRLVNTYKHDILEEELVSRQDIAAQREKEETLLYYSLLMDEPLGLMGSTKTMTYAFCAIQIPFEELLDRVLSRVSVEKLLSRLYDTPQFRGYLETLEEENSLPETEEAQKIQEAMDDLSENAPNPTAKEVLDQLGNLQKQKKEVMRQAFALQVLADAGFIMKKAE